MSLWCAYLHVQKYNGNKVKKDNCYDKLAKGAPFIEYKRYIENSQAF